MNFPPVRHLIRRYLLRWLLFLGIVYLGVVIVFWFLERSLVFHPTPPSESWLEPVEPRTQDVTFRSADGTLIHCWWLPPDHRRPEAGAVLVAHGNGGNLSHRGSLASDLHRTLGAGVLLFDYPGYGKSESKPSEEGCYGAGEAAYQWLCDEGKIPANRIILLGESLGGGTAVELATKHEHRALVLIFTFTSLPAVAKVHYPWLPTITLMQTRFDNLAKIGSCTKPIFIAHGTADEVVPIAHGETLFAAAREPKMFLKLPGFTHNLDMGESLTFPLAQFLKDRAR